MQPTEQVDAKKQTLTADDAIELLKQVNNLYAAKGKKVVHLNLKKERPAPDELLKLVVGPTGNLRAPTLRKGKTLIVGFHEETYEQLLK